MGGILNRQNIGQLLSKHSFFVVLHLQYLARLILTYIYKVSQVQHMKLDVCMSSYKTFGINYKVLRGA